MINSDLEQFLESGWYNEATLYYNGYIYWCEGQWDYNNKGRSLHFFVYKFPVEIVNEVYFRRLDADRTGNYEDVFDLYCNNIEDAKAKFINAKIFEGKSFEEIKDELAWYDEY